MIRRPPRSTQSRSSAASDVYKRQLEQHPARHELAGTLHERERGVALVEVPDARRQAQGAERPDAADAQDQLLVEPHLPSADVQDVGDRAVRVAVAGVVRVQQEAVSY